MNYKNDCRYNKFAFNYRFHGNQILQQSALEIEKKKRKQSDPAKEGAKEE